jgi:large subunit ribosomal protein L29
MKAADLREKSGDDLRELEKSLARDVFQNRLKNFTNRLDDTSAMRKTKRDLARVVTVLREQALGIARKGAAKPAGDAVVEAKAEKPAKAPKAEVKAAAADKPSKPAKSAAKKSATKAAKKGEAK